MSIADLIRRMSEAGAPPEAIAIAVEAIEEAHSHHDATSHKSSAAIRQARYRERKAQSVTVVTSRVTPKASQGVTSVTPPPALKDPLPNLVTVQVSPNPPPYSPPALAKPKRFPWPEDFREAVWSAYPRKTEKKPGIVALEALGRSDRVSFDDLTTAIHRMASTTEAQFCPALHRWIRNERWNDLMPVPSARAGPTGSRDAPRRLFGADRLLSTMNGMFDDDQQPTSAQPTLRLGAHQTADKA